MELSVSILNAKDRVKITRELNKTDINYIHIDVMDGKFVSQKTFLPEEIIEISKISEKKLDVHLMVEEPIDYIEKIKGLQNIEYITIHLEIGKNIKEIISKIKNYGFKVGLSIKPNTDISKIEPYLNDIDLILLMTVEPGLGGQKFIPSSKNRLKQLKKMVNETILLEVDGGINNVTMNEVAEADIAVVGTYITSSDNVTEKINSLLV